MRLLGKYVLQLRSTRTASGRPVSSKVRVHICPLSALYGGQLRVECNLSSLRREVVNTDANAWSGGMQLGGQVNAITQREPFRRSRTRTAAGLGTVLRC